MENAHLLFFVYNFIHKKSVETNWNFRNPSEDDYYWINHKFKRISGEYPFLEELREQV